MMIGAAAAKQGRGRDALGGRHVRARLASIASGWRLRQVDAPELMDRPEHSLAMLAGSLDDLRRINRWLGGVRLTLGGLNRLTRGLAPGTHLSILDVGTGGGDVPRAIRRWGRRRGFGVRLTLADFNPKMLMLAGRRLPGAARVAADARRLPFADGAFDVATCSLLVHHFEAADAVTVLQDLARVARRGLVVNDITRGWFGLVGAWAVTRTVARHPLTRYDGPLSVRRAYTRAELTALARLAGLREVEFASAFGYRVALTAVGCGGPGENCRRRSAD